MGSEGTSQKVVLTEQDISKVISQEFPSDVTAGKKILVLTPDTTRTCPLPMMIRLLNDKIRKALDLTKDAVLQLSYEKRGDREIIESLLLLFNVETVRLLKDSNEKYSFSRHKQGNWSLEHIHAQNSEGLNRREDQQMWLDLHRKSLLRLSGKSAAKEAVDAVIKDTDENYEAINQLCLGFVTNPGC